MTALHRMLAACRSLPAAICLLLLTAAPLMALEVPQLTARVNDYAAILSPATVTQLENSLSLFEQEQSTQIVVLTVTSLEGDSLEDFSLRVAEKWRVGQKGRDNGALLVIARNDRKIRIEVGYGLEGVLTDLVAGRIIRDVITPQFRNGNFDQGVVEGTAAMMAAVKGEFSAEPGRSSPGSTGTDPGGLLVPLLIGLFFLGRIFRSRWLMAGIGGIAAPVLGFFTFGGHWLIILALIPIGLVAGLLAGIVAASAGSGRMGGGGWRGGGGLGGGLGGFSGGFSGGGGGFGGGGASGGW